MWTNESDKALYLTADRLTVVDEGDARAAFLLVAAGGQLTDEEAKLYHLAQATDEKAKASPPENKRK